MIFAIFSFLGLVLFLFFWGRKIGNWKTVLFLQVGWLIKCLAAGAFFYVYSEIYGKGKLVEDAGAYIEEAKILNGLYHDDASAYFRVILNRGDFEHTIIERFKNVKISRIGPPSFLVNDTRNQIKFISLLSLVIGEDPLAIFSFFNLLSFIGLLVLWRVHIRKINLSSISIFAFLLLPISLLFWTSSPLKESTSLFGLSLFLAFLISSKTRLWWIIGIVGLLFIWTFKPYLVVLLALSVVIWWVYQKTIQEKKWPYLTALAIIVGMSFYFSLPKQILFTISDKQFDFVNVARGGVHMEGDTCFYFLEKKNRSKISIQDSVVEVLSPVRMIAIEKGKIRREQYFTLYPSAEKLRFEYEQLGGSSYFETRPINRKWSNLFLSIPESLFNVAFRPFPWTHFFSFQNSILFLENLFFLFLLFEIGRKRKQINSQYRTQLIPIFLICSLLLALIIGWTTPISGAIVRYRIPIHLFILISYLMTHLKKNTQCLKKPFS